MPSLNGSPLSFTGWPESHELTVRNKREEEFREAEEMLRSIQGAIPNYRPPQIPPHRDAEIIDGRPVRRPRLRRADDDRSQSASRRGTPARRDRHNDRGRGDRYSPYDRRERDDRRGGDHWVADSRGGDHWEPSRRPDRERSDDNRDRRRRSTSGRPEDDRGASDRRSAEPSQRPRPSSRMQISYD